MIGSNSVKIVIIIVSVILMAYLLNEITKYYRERKAVTKYLIKGEHSALKPKEFEQKKLNKSMVGNEYTYMFWVKIDDWGHNYSQAKHVFHVGDEKANSVSPGVWFYPKNNNLMVRVDTHHRIKNLNKTLMGQECQNWTSQYPHKHEYTVDKYPDAGLGDHNYCRNPDNNKDMGSWCFTNDKSVEKGECSKTAYDSENNAPSMNPNANPQEVDIKRPCDISNIPLQKWVHIGIVLSNRTLSVFMDGKLSRSCVLKNVPKVVDGKLYLFQNEGFNGKISDFMYVNYALSAANINSQYKKGYDAMDLASGIPRVTVKLEYD